MKDVAVLSAKSTHHLSFNDNEISAASNNNKFETPIIQLTLCSEAVIGGNRFNGEGINKNILVQAMPVENITIMPEQEFVVCVK